MSTRWFTERLSGARSAAVEAGADEAIVLLDRVAADQDGRPPVMKDFERYDDAVRLTAAALSAGCLVADQYATMDDFWSDAAAQEKGLSTGTFWDTYEHGRRRQLERALATAYGSPDAVLVNSGMAGIYTALVTATEHGRRPLRLPERRYFETHDLVENVPLGRPADPSLGSVAFLEPVTNAPTLDVNDPATLGPEVDRFVVDNSLFGHAFPYRDLSSWVSGRPVLVVESVAKYLSGLISGGVVYGDREAVDTVRAFARRTGQLLQGAALAYLTPGDIRLASTRIRTHMAAAAEFAAHVDQTSWEIMEPDAALLRRAALPSGLRTGSLLFLRPSDRGADCAAIVDRWVAATAALDQPVRLQAGFGWPWTTTRSYGVDRLNQPDGPRYIRISVGAVDPTHVKQQALALNTVSS
ncbi:hypothetical protein [Streptomyces sp. NRRL F-2799]|uniref:hypothetical protein n=1 Tax=Streptomyces sp. NRRL F-2799 TaxID=1463844 RepID=UPI0004C81BC2|nr:hypothetical protein [Streptomyces sp. NRRL F-2799]